MIYAPAAVCLSLYMVKEAEQRLQRTMHAENRHILSVCGTVSGLCRILGVFPHFGPGFAPNRSYMRLISCLTYQIVPLPCENSSRPVSPKLSLF